jgi:predicted nucleic acid-binding protein
MPVNYTHAADDMAFTPRSPHDCLIACIAIEHGTPLLHDDKDFEAIARVEPRLLLEPIQEKT